MKAHVCEAVDFMKQRRHPLGAAVRAAICAYEKSGRMLDAALAYAAHGIPIFPLDPKSKRPIPRRDPDPTEKYPRGIPGTGGVYKATCDSAIIRGWWGKNPHALIGVPMGAKTGAWALDVDTPEDHEMVWPGGMKSLRNTRRSRRASIEARPAGRI